MDAGYSAGTGKARNTSLTSISRGRRSVEARWGWRVDPGGGWFVGWGGRLVDETLRVFAERGGEGGLAGGVNGIGLAVMHLVRRHEADAGVMVVLIVPVEEWATEAPGVLDAAEALRKARLVFEGFEVAFGERVVVGRVRTVVRTGDAEIGQQQGGGFRLHRAAAIGVQRELTGRHVVFGDGVVEQWAEQARGFGIGDAPTDDAAAEDARG